MRWTCKSKSSCHFNKDLVPEKPQDHIRLVTDHQHQGWWAQMTSSQMFWHHKCLAQARRCITRPRVAYFSQIMANLHHRVKLRKLVKEHMKTRVSWLRDNIVYCEGETSTNLSSRTASTDLGFKHREADTMMLSAHSKLPKSSCSRQRWHRRVRASSRCLA